MYIKSIFRFSLLTIIMTFGLFECKASVYKDYDHVVVHNKSDVIIYAAIYYSSERATDIVEIQPGSDLTIDLPPWKLFKTRKVCVTKYKERLVNNLSDLSFGDYVKLSTSTAEVGRGKNAHRNVYYTEAGLSFNF